jgi:hypothetical protein
MIEDVFLFIMEINRLKNKELFYGKIERKNKMLSQLYEIFFVVSSLLING